MVMEYIPDGDIRRYLQDNQLTFKDKLDQLNHIAEGLKAIHEQGLIHHDFHAGNILNKRYKHNNDCYITDLGLCRPVDKINDGKIYGVLPYVAPEVL
jgi:serine/threonine protein kinase